MSIWQTILNSPAPGVNDSGEWDINIQDTTSTFAQWIKDMSAEDKIEIEYKELDRIEAIKREEIERKKQVYKIILAIIIITIVIFIFKKLK